MYCVVRIRGTVNVSPKAKKTLEMLNLRRANNASVWLETNQAKKMIKLVDHMITFGKIDDSTLEELITKRGEAVEGKLDVKKVMEGLKSGKTANQVGLVNCFRLNPPKGGFERKGVKVPYGMGGAYGNRKNDMSELVKKMI